VDTAAGRLPDSEGLYVVPASLSFSGHGIPPGVRMISTHAFLSPATTATGMQWRAPWREDRGQVLTVSWIALRW
jgi:hypothetical protein